MSLRDWYFCYLIKELKKKEMEKTFWRWKLNVNQDAKTMRTQFSQTTISQRKYVKLHHIILRYSVKSCIKRPIFENPILDKNIEKNKMTFMSPNATCLQMHGTLKMNVTRQRFSLLETLNFCWLDVG